MSDRDDERRSAEDSSLQRTVIELTFAVRALAENTDVMHQDLRKLMETNHRSLDQVLDRVDETTSKHSQILQVLPISTSDRLERLIDKKVDGVLEDVRISVNDIRQKLYYYTREKEATHALAPAAAVVDESTTSFEIKKDEVRFKFKTDGVEKAWKILRWVGLAILAGGGGWSILKNLIHSSGN